MRRSLPWSFLHDRHGVGLQSGELLVELRKLVALRLGFGGDVANVVRLDLFLLRGCALVLGDGKRGDHGSGLRLEFVEFGVWC